MVRNLVRRYLSQVVLLYKFLSVNRYLLAITTEYKPIHVLVIS